jgi:hypothetical protein
MAEAAPSTLAQRHLDVGARYVLRSIGLLGSVFDGDVVRGLVFLSALEISTGRAADGSVDRAAPVSLSAIARSLRMSIETTRRHVIKLERDGFVARSPKGGVLIAAALMDRPEMREALTANSGNLFQMSQALAALSSPGAAPGPRSGDRAFA